jgi:hypothetical protein
MQNCGSVTYGFRSAPLTTDRDSELDPAIVVSHLKMATNNYFFSYYFLKLHLHHFLKIKSQISHKTDRIKAFLTILREDRRIRIRT